MYGSDGVKGEPSPMFMEISGRGRRRSRGVRGNQRVGDFRFINIVLFFSIYYYYLFIIFSILFLPTTFTHTHTHDPQHLATLVSRWKFCWWFWMEQPKGICKQRHCSVNSTRITDESNQSKQHRYSWGTHVFTRFKRSWWCTFLSPL